MLEELLQLLLVDQWADHCVNIIGIADLQLSNPLCEEFDEFVINPFVDNQTIDSHADLPLMQKLSKKRRFDRESQISIVKDHAWRIAAQLKDHPLKNRALRCKLHNATSYLSGSCE